MVILRRTEKLKSTLPVTEVVPDNSETALGDWYVNRIVIDRRPLLLLISSTTYLPLLLPAKDTRSLPDRLGALVEVRLERCGIDTDLVAAESLLWKFGVRVV
jgi:hypothetical protein